MSLFFPITIAIRDKKNQALSKWVLSNTVISFSLMYDGEDPYLRPDSQLSEYPRAGGCQLPVRR